MMYIVNIVLKAGRSNSLCEYNKNKFLKDLSTPRDNREVMIKWSNSAHIIALYMYMLALFENI